MVRITLGEVTQKSACPTLQAQGGFIYNTRFEPLGIEIDMTFTTSFLRQYGNNKDILHYIEEEFREVIEEELERRLSV